MSDDDEESYIVSYLDEDGRQITTICTLVGPPQPIDIRPVSKRLRISNFSVEKMEPKW